MTIFWRHLVLCRVVHAVRDMDDEELHGFRAERSGRSRLGGWRFGVYRNAQGGGAADGSGYLYGRDIYLLGLGQFLRSVYPPQSPEKFPASLKLYQFFGQYGMVDYGDLAAFSVLYAIPAIIMYILSQQFMSKGFGRRAERRDRENNRIQGMGCPK